MEQQGKKVVMYRWAVVCAVMFMVLAGIAGCGGDDQEKDNLDLLPGNWVYSSNRTYILTVIDMKGTWTSSVKVSDVTSKIVAARGKANGTWHMDEGQLIFNVMASDIDNVWEKDGTYFYKVLDLSKHLMLLEGENGRREEWKKTIPKKVKAGQGPVNPIVGMAPYAVNMDKLSSNTQDRYLCLSMHLALKELMPEQPVPQFHPRARDAVIMFLASLTYDNVSDFERLKVQKEKIKDVINPYMEGLVQEVVIDHVVIAASADKVEEFIIEHTATPTPEEPAEGEAGKTAEEGEEKEKS